MNTEVKKMLFCMLGGVIAIVMGIWGLVSDNTDAKNDTESAQATVVAWVEGESYNSATEGYDIVYYPVVTYTAGDQEIKSQYSQYYSDKEFNIGETIDIKYNPDKPEEFVVAGEHRGTFAAMWEIPLGIALIIFPIGKWIWIMKKSR